MHTGAARLAVPGTRARRGRGRGHDQPEHGDDSKRTVHGGSPSAMIASSFSPARGRSNRAKRPRRARARRPRVVAALVLAMLARDTGALRRLRWGGSPSRRADTCAWLAARPVLQCPLWVGSGLRGPKPTFHEHRAPRARRGDQGNAPRRARLFDRTVWPGICSRAHAQEPSSSFPRAPFHRARLPSRAPGHGQRALAGVVRALGFARHGRAWRW